MKLSSSRFHAPRAGVWLVTLAAALLMSGCENVFVPKHRVLVDAIAAPGITKPSGKSYRLVAKRTMVSNTPVQIPILKACVDAALTGQGMYEPPPNTPPELVIEVSCGRDASSRALASVRETFLQLSARSNPQRALDKATGPEEWDVRVAVLGLSGSMETALPLLSAVAAEHMGSNTGLETRIEVLQNSPVVESVRLAAIKSLESQAQRVAAATAQPSSPAPIVVDPKTASATPKAAPSAAGSAPISEGKADPSVLTEPIEVTPTPEPANSPAGAGGSAQSTATSASTANPR